MGLREDKKQRLRSDLYETAVALFRAQGYDDTRVHDIVTRVGVTEPTFFNHFGSKEAVLEEFAARALDGFLDVLRAEVDDRTATTGEKMRALLARLADAFAADRQFMATVATRSSLFWGARGGVLEREFGMYELLTELFRRGQERGEVRAELDPRRLAETFTGAYMLAVVNWLVGWWGDRADLHDRLGEVADVVLDGCLTRRQGRRARTTQPAAS